LRHKVDTPPLQPNIVLQPSIPTATYFETSMPMSVSAANREPTMSVA
jgi:hypothetical protein